MGLPTVTAWFVIDSDLGRFVVGGTHDVISRVLLPGDLDASLLDELASTNPSTLVRRAAGEIAEFLDGSRQGFDLPFEPLDLGDFRSRVWSVIDSIPYGETLTYGEVALEAGAPRAARAVGTACGANPIPLLRPCHRVVAAQGIGGYGGGVELKRALLDREVD